MSRLNEKFIVKFLTFLLVVVFQTVKVFQWVTGQFQNGVKVVIWRGFVVVVSPASVTVIIDDGAFFAVHGNANRYQQTVTSVGAVAGVDINV